jgi:hypothetical protein
MKQKSLNGKWTEGKKPVMYKAYAYKIIKLNNNDISTGS